MSQCLQPMNSTSVPTRVTPKTKTCLDHFKPINHFSTETLKTTISDDYSVLLKIPDAEK